MTASQPAALAVVAGCVVLWVLVSSRLERLNIGAPIAFVVMGLAVTHRPLLLVHLTLHSSSIRSLAEITLAVVLFTDASRVNLHELRRDAGLAVRLLGIGLPLTIGFGTAAAAALFGGSGLWVAALLGAIVAPTDAALGATVIQDTRVPARIRRLLNVESGLNDGIATPFVNFFLAGALSSEVAHTAHLTGALRELVVGIAVGTGVGAIGAWLLRGADRRAWSAPGFRPLACLGLSLLAYGAAVEASGNGFIAAFVAGMAFGTVLREVDEATIGFTEDTAELLTLLVWFVFGAGMVVPGFEHADWRNYLFAVLALTAVRMIPVALSLSGSGCDRATVAFVGWFGPRGLASVVFGLVAYDSLAAPESGLVLSVVTVTVTLSVVAHGLSAGPLAQRYGRRAGALSARHPEHVAAPTIRARPLQGPASPRVAGGGA